MPEGTVVAAPVGKCKCCGHYFMYIDFGSYQSTGDYLEIINDTEVCPTCGGRPERTVVKNGVRVEYEPGSKGSPSQLPEEGEEELDRTLREANCEHEWRFSPLHARMVCDKCNAGGWQGSL
jgi:hypothetical protein